MTEFKLLALKMPKNPELKLNGGRDFAMQKAKQQIIAVLCAKLYRFKIDSFDDLGFSHMFYLFPIIYQIEDGNFNGCNYLYAEPYISLKDGKLQKNLYNQDLQAFTHFTF